MVATRVGEPPAGVLVICTLLSGVSPVLQVMVRTVTGWPYTASPPGGTGHVCTHSFRIVSAGWITGIKVGMHSVGSPLLAPFWSIEVAEPLSANSMFIGGMNEPDTQVCGRGVSATSARLTV